MLKKLVAIVIAAALAVVASAQSENLLPEPGSKFVGFSGQWTSIDDADLANINLTLDYYATPHFAGKFGVSYIRVDSEDLWFTSLMGRLLLAKEGATLPYLQVGGVYYDALDESKLTYGLGGGVEHYVSKDQAFFIDFLAFEHDRLDKWIYITSFGFKMKF